MSDSRIVFIRHGESMGNVWPGAYQNEACNFLTLRGVKQAELAGIDLIRHGFKFEHVITSALTRARHTAATIMQTMDDWQRIYHEEPKLNEWTQIGHVFDSRFVRLEDRRDFETRVKEAYEDTILRAHKEFTGDILVVSHFYTMEAIFDHIGVPVTNNMDQDWIPNATPFILDPGNSWRMPSLKMLHAYVQLPQS